MVTDNKAMVAVCDILGFSNFVKKAPLREMIDVHIPNIYELVQASSRNLVKKTVQPNSSDIVEHHIIGSAVFSDTVLFYSLEDSKLAYDYVIYGCQ